jgi:photosystem II stability/assembly factor-like uncharacterized protein
MNLSLSSWALWMLVFFGVTATCTAQRWQQCEGPEGGSYWSLASDSSGVLYAGSHSHGLFVSRDHGETWKLTNDSLHVRFITTICATKDNTVYMASYGGPQYSIVNKGHLFKSTDQGQTWRTLNAKPIESHIYRLTASPTGALYCHTYTRFYASLDSGKTWQERKPIGAFIRVRDITVTASGAVWVSADSGLVRSTDNGVTWKWMTQGLPRDVRGDYDRLHVRSDGTLFLSEFVGYRIFKLPAGDTVWQLAGTKPTLDLTYQLSTLRDGRVVAADAYDGLNYSTNDGATWENFPLPGMRHFVHEVIEDPDGRLFTTSGYVGLLRSTDRGVTWSATNRGLNSQVVYKLAANIQGELYAGTIGGLVRSADQGRTWANVARPGKYSRALAIDSSGTIYSSDDSTIWRSMDNAQTWTRLALDPKRFYTNWITIGPDNSVYVLFQYEGSESRMLRSFDRGESWHRLDTALPNKYVYQIIPVTNDELWVAQGSKGVWHTTNGGVSWNHQSQRLSWQQFHIARHPSGAMFAGGWVNLHRLVDTGWVTVSSNLYDQEIRSLMIRDDTIFCATNYALYRSHDLGKSWSRADTGMRGNPVNQLIFDRSGIGYAIAEGAGIFRTRHLKQSRVASPLKPAELVQIELLNREVRIHPRKAVHIRIMDVLGRTFRTLHGSSPAHVSAADLPAGWYIVTATDGVETTSTPFLLH